MLKIIRSHWNRLTSKLNLVAYLTAENMALRQQINVLMRNRQRPVLKGRDRLFWVVLSYIWPKWRDALVLVQPDTVVRWHKKSFKRYWRWKSQRGKRGRPEIDINVKQLIRNMANANPLWAAPRIHGELLSLGLEISERTVSRILHKHKPKQPSSQTWRTFIKNHMPDMASIDFMVVPTIRFRMLYVFVVLSHVQRRVLHFNVTANPTAEWTAQQIVEAFPWDTAPKYLLRDRDSIYGEKFKERVHGMNIKNVMTAYHCPWQNPYVERLHGSIRRECTDHVIIHNERHLRRILREYFEYYHEDRTHLGLGKETPMGRPTTSRASPSERLVALPRAGGLQHRYEWRKTA